MTEAYDDLARPLRDTAITAASAVAALYDQDNGRFWRDTAHREFGATDSIGRLFPTVSLCCTQALILLERTRPTWCTGTVSEASSHASSIVPMQLTFDSLSGSSLAEAEERPPAFTVAQLLQTLALVVAPDDHEKLLAAFDEALAHASKPLQPAASGPGAHPFVLYHLAKGLEESRALLPEREEAASSVLADIYLCLERLSIPLLAEYRAGRATPADLVALAFCGAGLAADVSGESDRYAVAALEVAAEGQEASGCWALGRLVRGDRYSDHGDPLEIEISTYEISGSIADALLALRSRSSAAALEDATQALLAKLRRSAGYASNSLVRLPHKASAPTTGWCGDHPFNVPIVESWTSATVLRASLSIERLIRSLESEAAIRQFAYSRPDDTTWPGWLRWPALLDTGETDHQAGILGYIDENLIKPIMESRDRLPSAEAGSVSALLFGPPGTSKTTIVRGVADALAWPLVELNPGVFIEGGLELIEAQARKVFDSLHRMERTVVLFDECDELFRARGPLASSEQIRSITAFVTASMLPKLQKLHDEGRVVFFICTNNFGSLDSAVKRRGRVDHIVAVGPPDERARELIVRTGLRDRSNAEAPARLWQGTERFSRGELVYLVREFKAACVASPQATIAELDEIASARIDELKPSLNISPQLYNDFEAEKRTSSAPHIRRDNDS